MKKIGTMQALSNEILKEQKITIGLDLGDLRSGENSGDSMHVERNFGTSRHYQIFS